MCSHKRGLGRQPKLYSPIPEQLGALCRWLGYYSSCYKSVNRKNSFETHHFKVKNDIFVALQTIRCLHNIYPANNFIAILATRYITEVGKQNNPKTEILFTY